MTDKELKQNATEGSEGAISHTFTKEKIQKIKDGIGPHERHTTGPEIYDEGKSKE